MVGQLRGGIKSRWRCKCKDIEEERRRVFLLVWETRDRENQYVKGPYYNSHMKGTIVAHECCHIWNTISTQDQTGRCEVVIPASLHDSTPLLKVE